MRKIISTVALATAAITLATTTPTHAVDKTFSCRVPATGWNNGCVALRVPAHHTVHVYLRTANNERVQFRINGSTCGPIGARQWCKLWANTKNIPVDVSVGASSWSLNAIQAEGKVQTRSE